MTADASIDWLAITVGPLPVAAAVDFVTAPCAGGINVFLGTTRSETHADGRTLVALDYEAYTEMAQQQFQDLARRSREQFGLIKITILHRVGRVGLGEPSVVIAVSSTHRAAAFDASRWIIDTLKKEVAIWKKEVWSDGSLTWVQPPA